MRETSKAHERSHYRFSRFSPAFPAQWFYGLFRALPGERILVVTVVAGLMPATWHQQRVSGPHDLAVRFSAFVQRDQMIAL
jgi:hypothetical protein